MKKYLAILCLLGAITLIGCATTGANNTTAKKAEAQHSQKSGTYFGGGVGVGVMSF
ncbi:MAG: hypothetical protein QNK11_00175 [Legionella sp.]|nr:hypothetical protein [Legionella sp.]